jgi:hypothetical protein
MEHLSWGGLEHRYGRVAHVLLEDENLSDEELARQAEVDVVTARYCRIAFIEVREALRLKGWRAPRRRT